MSSVLMPALVKGIRAHLKTGEPRTSRDPYKIWARDLNMKCYRKFWYECNMVGAQEDYSDTAGVKFLLGDAVESVVDYLFEKGGEKPTDHQLRLEHTLPNISGTVPDIAISGKVDFIAGGRVVEVKSINEWGFNKMRTEDYMNHLDSRMFDENPLAKDSIHHEYDPLGYVHQLAFYMHKLDKPGTLCVVNKNSGDILAYDLTKNNIPSIHVLEEKAATLTHIATKSIPPKRPSLVQPVVERNGNERLCSTCNFCPFKMKCYGEDLRGFLYSDGIKYYSKIVKQPKVIEVKLNHV